MHLIVKKPYLEKLKIFLQAGTREITNNQLLFKVTKNSLILFLASPSTNTYMRLELGLNAFLDIKSPGIAVINAKMLGDLMGKLDLSQDLEIYHTDNQYFQFFSGSYECDLVLINRAMIEDNRLDVKEERNIRRVMITYESLRQSYIYLKDFCKVFDNAMITNPVLVYINLQKKKESPYIESYASDAYRIVHGEFKSNDDSEFNINFHPNALSLLVGIYVKQIQLDVYLNEVEGYMVVHGGEYSVKMSLDITPYPEFKHWFNMPQTIDFTVSKQDLLEVIDRNLLLPNKESQITHYVAQNDSLLVEYKNSERGRCREYLEIKGPLNQKVEFYLNNLLLRSLTKSVETDEVVFKVCDSLKPILLMPTTPTPFKRFILPSKNV